MKKIISTIIKAGILMALYDLRVMKIRPRPFGCGGLVPIGNICDSEIIKLPDGNVIIPNNIMEKMKK